MWVHSADKVGKDAGELAGGDPVGLAATPDRDAGAVPDYLKLLGAGINVVSTSTYVTEWRGQLESAAQTGGASFYASTSTRR